MKLSLEIKALIFALIAATLALGSAGAVAASIQMMPRPEPDEFAKTSSSPEIVAQGHEFFSTSCSECHGEDAHGDEGPDLHRIALSNARIATTIRKGVKGEMPSFAKKYNEAQIAALVAYVRSLR